MGDQGGTRRPPKIFISYRRAESEGDAGRLYDALSRQFGSQQVFWDFSSISGGRKFGDAIEQAVGKCDVFLAVIGTSWASVTDSKGRRRLDDPDDWVRRELEIAMSAGVYVIPVLFQGAPIPAESELPEGLRPLVGRQAIRMTSATWSFDVERLVADIENATVARGDADSAATATLERSGASANELHFPYDAYVSYVEEEPDATWVWDTLVPRMERAGLRVAVSGDVQQPGVDRLVAVEQGVREAKRTVVVLSPAYLRNNMADFESVLAQTVGVDEGLYRVLPVAIGASADLPLPQRLRMLTVLELGHGRRAERNLDRLVQALRDPLPRRRTL